MVQYWGDIYQGKRTSWTAAGDQYTPQYLYTRGLLWRDGRLYWTYYNDYNVTNDDEWCIGFTSLGADPSQMVAHGPWRPTTSGQGPGSKHASWWLVEMPDGTLGAGATLIGGNLVSSWGPELLAGCPFPVEATPSGFGTPNIVFSQTHVRYEAMYGKLTIDGALAPGQEIVALRRDGNYVFHNTNPQVGYPEAPTEIDPLQNGGVGTFTQVDRVMSCVPIFLPNKSGYLFVGVQGNGHVWYGGSNDCGHGASNPCGGGQGPNASGHNQQWWIYDPADCQKVVSGAVSPWQIQPSSAFDPSTLAPLQLGCEAAPGGAYFDPETRRLYVAAIKADDSLFGLHFPLIHVFQVGGTP